MIFQLYLEKANDGACYVIINSGRGDEAKWVDSVPAARQLVEAELEKWFKGGKEN